jgi:phosphoenolpyruvate carboxylase
VRGQIRLTEQGEVIASKYANPEIRPQSGDPGGRHAGGHAAADQAGDRAFLEAAALLSETSMAAYRALVYETPGFTDYFFSSTPIREIAELNIGSRPASRKATQAIEDLRAIPWGFSWGQCRLTLPAWSVSARRSRPSSTVRARMPEPSWRCCSDVPPVAVLPHPAVEHGHGAGQERPGLASRYSELVTDTRCASRIFGAIEAEWQSTVEALNQITGDKQRLEHNSALARSIRHRFPYRSSEPSAGGAGAAGVRDRPTTGSRTASICPSMALPPECATRVETDGGS